MNVHLALHDADPRDARIGCHRAVTVVRKGRATRERERGCNGE
jgi:hypothetical protein